MNELSVIGACARCQLAVAAMKITAETQPLELARFILDQDIARMRHTDRLTAEAWCKCEAVTK